MAENKGHKNLVPQNRKTKEEQRRIASMGGKASGEARRRRKALKEYMEILLECEPDAKTTNKLLRMGIEPEDITVAMAMAKAMAEEVLKGNVPAFKEVRDLVGEIDKGGQPDAPTSIKVHVHPASPPKRDEDDDNE